MTVNESPKRHAPVAASKRRLAQRVALVTGGVVAGFAGSALAGFGLVSLLFPHSGLPGAGAVYRTGPVAEVSRALIPSPVVTVPVQMVPARATATPATVAAAGEPASAAAETGPDPVRGFDFETRTVTRMVRGAPAEMVSDPAEPRPVAPVAIAAAQGPAGTTGAGAPAAATRAPDVDVTGFGPRIALLPPDAATGPAAMPAEATTGATTGATTEDFATLASVDAETRAGAGLFGTGRTRAETVETAAVTAAEDATGMRPAARPDAPAPVVLAAAPSPLPASAAPLVSPRPQPRPEIVVAAAGTAPRPDPAAAPETEIEVDTVISTAGAPRAGRILGGGTAECGRTLARAMPARKGGATGSEFFAGLGGLQGPDRDARVIAELAKGNMPGFLHDLQPVRFQGRDGRGAAVEITLCVTPDYLALGSDKDYVRVPLGLPAAARIAGAFDMTLPTPTMVDAIYAQAAVKLSPSPMTPGPQMQSTPYLVAHNATIEKQLGGRRGLIAGQKKDVVMASRMASNPGRVAIYGWHQKSGNPIQPVSTVHGENYADYSHGIRLVSKTAYLNGKPVALADLLASSRYAQLLNEGGPMPGPVIRIASN